jgi:hypothetical protein
MEIIMTEAISLIVILIVAAVMYELLKPKSDYQATNHRNNSDEED